MYVHLKGLNQWIIFTAMLRNLQRQRWHLHHLPTTFVARRLDPHKPLAASLALFGVVEHDVIRILDPGERPTRMALLSAGLLGAFASKALGLRGFGEAVARGWLTIIGIATV